MDTTRLGSTGLRVSEFCLGTATFGREMDGGPFRGTTTEPIDPDLVLTYVEVDVGGSIVGTAAIPEHCYGVTGADVGQMSNTRTNPSSTDAVSSTWTTEDASIPTVA